MSISRNTFFNIVKFSSILVMGVIITVNPNSLLTIMLFVTGLYLCISGFNSLISTLSLIKYQRGWIYEGIRTLIYLIIGLSLLFNSSGIATLVSGLISVLIGLFFIILGIMAIYRTKESSSGIFFIVIGIIIAIFPLGFSYLITRIIGVSLIILASYLLYSIKARSF